LEYRWLGEFTTRVRFFAARSRRALISTLGKPAPPKPDMKMTAPFDTSARASAAVATRLSIGIVACAFHLELGGLNLLMADLCTRGIVTKVRSLKTRRSIGGSPFTRGPLAHLLRN